MVQQKRQTERLQKAVLFETAMAVLGLLWMALLVIELVYGLSPFLSTVFNVIWAIFVLDFSIRFWRSRNKRRYLKKNWLVGISLLIPALRIFRIFTTIRILRVASVVRGIQFARLFASFRRAVRALGSTMHRRGFGYVAGITAIVIFSGAAGMYAYERNAPLQDGFGTYGESLWWTGMIITTLGSQHWPVTPEGRILCLILSIYAVTILGYIAATLASFFIGRDATQAVHPQDVHNLQETIDRLNQELQEMAGPLQKMQQEKPPPDRES